MKNLKLREGEPCKHIGCASHITHPCEGCGRVRMRKKKNCPECGLDIDTPNGQTLPRVWLFWLNIEICHLCYEERRSQND